MWFSSILTRCRDLLKFPETIAPLAFSLFLVFALAGVLGALITIPVLSAKHYNNEETPVTGCKNGTRSTSAGVAQIGHLSLALLESVTAAAIVVALAWDLVIMG
ncbi:hypothetical protein PG997_001871 [Apiospora hydei]|uniref:Uncharacterized protein n=1 Tax=Apiospora hydei TaxID=1337664 RepID=A0ABR1X7S0_9PEZI